MLIYIISELSQEEHFNSYGATENQTVNNYEVIPENESKMHCPSGRHFLSMCDHLLMALYDNWVLPPASVNYATEHQYGNFEKNLHLVFILSYFT